MRRFWFPAVVGSCLLAISTLLYAAAALSVQVQSTKLRAEPKFWGAVVATLNLGDKVTPVKQTGDWFQVTAAGKTGWVHKTAVTSRDVALGGSGASVPTQTSTKEVSMGGKGFNNSVEKQYQTETDLDFAPVDSLGKIRVSDADLEAFLEQGGLADWGKSR